MLAKREVACAGIQDNVRAAGGTTCPGAIGDPCVFANFKPDTDTTNVEDDVAQRVGFTIEFNFRDNTIWPCLEPSRLVMDTIACQMLFPNKSEDFFVCDQASRVKQTT